MSVYERRKRMEEELRAAQRRVRELEGILDKLQEECPHTNVSERRNAPYPPWIKYCVDCGKENLS